MTKAKLKSILVHLGACHARLPFVEPDGRKLREIWDEVDRVFPYGWLLGYSEYPIDLAPRLMARFARMAIDRFAAVGLDSNEFVLPIVEAWESAIDGRISHDTLRTTIERWNRDRTVGKKQSRPGARARRWPAYKSRRWHDEDSFRRGAMYYDPRFWSYNLAACLYDYAYRPSMTNWHSVRAFSGNCETYADVDQAAMAAAVREMVPYDAVEEHLDRIYAEQVRPAIDEKRALRAA